MTPEEIIEDFVDAIQEKCDEVHKLGMNDSACYGTIECDVYNAHDLKRLADYLFVSTNYGKLYGRIVIDI